MKATEKIRFNRLLSLRFMGVRVGKDVISNDKCKTFVVVGLKNRIRYFSGNYREVKKWLEQQVICF